ncbi:MAG: DUF2934 domain-containing protein [Acidobacteriia bacterium]|nr:DUF2934 domain-containing protein [Terriglobia bacterium]
MTAADATARAASRHPGPSPQEREQAIRRRAQELYEQRGRVAGHEVEDWLRAEAEVMREVATALRRRSAHIVVKVDGVTYTGEYDPESSAGYQPGEFAVGQPLQVRFEGDRMYIARSNHRELQARLVKKVT